MFYHVMELLRRALHQLFFHVVGTKLPVTKQIQRELRMFELARIFFEFFVSKIEQFLPKLFVFTLECVDE